MEEIGRNIRFIWMSTIGEIRR